MTYDEVGIKNNIARILSDERINVWEYCLRFSIRATVSKHNQEQLYNAYLKRWSLGLVDKLNMYKDNWEHLAMVVAKSKLLYKK
jgi:hypothetical protein